VTYFLPPALERIKNTYCMGQRPFLYLYWIYYYFSYSHWAKEWWRHLARLAVSNTTFLQYIAVYECRHVVKLEKEAVDLGLISTTTAKPDEPGSSDQQIASKS